MGACGWHRPAEGAEVKDSSLQHEGNCSTRAQAQGEV